MRYHHGFHARKIAIQRAFKCHQDEIKGSGSKTSFSHQTIRVMPCADTHTHSHYRIHTRAEVNTLTHPRCLTRTHMCSVLFSDLLTVLTRTQYCCAHSTAHIHFLYYCPQSLLCIHTASMRYRKAECTMQHTLTHSHTFSTGHTYAYSVLPAYAHIHTFSSSHSHTYAQYYTHMHAQGES